MTFASLAIEQAYRTGEIDPADQFFSPVLREAKTYDRAVGFFRSTFLSVVGAAIVEFSREGGRIRLICSPRLSEEDIAALEQGHDLREQIVASALMADLELILCDSSLYRCAEMLATLIALQILEIRIAVREPSQGLYHEKLGVFTDSAGNLISFTGSSNETFGGLHRNGNFESIEVFSSLWGSGDVARTRRHRNYFERLWKNQASGVTVMPFPEAVGRKLLLVAKDSLEEWDTSNAGTPKQRELLPHQVEAIRSWEQANRRGIFQHATGSGKTFTALSIISDHIKFGNPALIVVPSKLLLEQWVSEITSELPHAKILAVGGANHSWKRMQGSVSSFTNNMVELGPRVLIATMHTASSHEFLSQVSSGTHLLLVADEVHQIGSPKLSHSLNIDAGSRLGLSATPVRYGDDVGTKRIMDYFGGVLAPIVTLADAVRSGRLVSYRYYPHTILLNPAEEEQWEIISKEIARQYAIAKTSGDNSIATMNQIKMLLIRRSRIAKKAEAKISLATSILSDKYESGSRWLVYCDDQDQLTELRSRLQHTGILPLEYHSNMQSDQQATLDHFQNFGGIMISIRCLDEGVDIPSIDNALILASSQNPRQFIQRRGRVLRASPNKTEAVIHDALVRPTHSDDNPFQMGHFRSELLRAIEFATSASNPACITELMEIATDVGLDPNEILAVDDIEEDE